MNHFNFILNAKRTVSSLITVSVFFIFSGSDIYSKSPLWSDPASVPTLPEEVAEMENIEKQRKAGFPDYEIDALHAAIGRMLLRIDPSKIPEGPGNFKELTEVPFTRKIIRGKDSTGKDFYRVRIREGKGYSTDIYPMLYTYRVDCYLYPGEKGLSQVIFHFYRINHGKDNYVREIRRFIHTAPGNLPEPGENQEAAAGQETAGTSSVAKLASNADVMVEYYEAPSKIRPSWEGPDGVPLPVFDYKPLLTFKLMDENNPMPYRRQVAVVRRYRRMLRTALASLEFVYRSQELEKALILEKVMEF